MKQTPLRPVSKKRSKLLRERKKLTDSMKREGPVMCGYVQWISLNQRGGTRDCAMPCQSRADDLHEIVSRARGGSVTDPENVVPLCRPHHIWVTEHPKEAAELGLSRRAQ